MNEYIFSEQCNESPLTSHELNFIVLLIRLINASYNRLYVIDTFLCMVKKNTVSKEEMFLSTSTKCCLLKPFNF